MEAVNKFENRNDSSNPIIKRLKYDNMYIYVITTLTGCNCGYIGCDSYNGFRLVLKVRKIAEKKENCELILTKNGRTKIKLINEINEEEAIEIYNKNY